MPLIPLRRDRASKPPLGTPLRSDGHWSVQGLVGAWAFNEGAGRRFFGLGGVLSATGGDWTGDGYKTSGASSASLTLANSDGAAAFNFEGDFTVLTKCRLDQTAGGNKALFAKGGITTPYPFFVHIDNSNNRWTLARVGSSGTPVAALLLHGTVSNISTFAVGKNGPQLFCWTQNGASQSYQTVTDTTTGTHANTQPFTMGMRDNGYFNVSNTYEQTLIYSHALSSTEIASLSANPWQIYDPEIVWVTVGGGSATSITGISFTTLADLTATAAATLGLVGQSSVTLGALTPAATGALGLVGSADVTLGSVTPNASATAAIRAAANQTLGSLGQTAAGAINISGSSAVALSPLSQVAAGYVGAVPVVGSSAVLLTPVIPWASGELWVAGYSLQALDPATVAGSGYVSITAAASKVLTPVAQVATGVSGGVPAIDTGLPIFADQCSPRSFADLCNPRSIHDVARPRSFANLVSPRGTA